MSWFIFDGVDTRDLGLSVFRTNSIFEGASEQYDEQIVPGRSQSLLVARKRREPVEQEYLCALRETGIDAALALVRDALLSKTGYHRLEDSFAPDEFYSAYIDRNIIMQVSRDMQLAKFRVVFKRTGERFLKSGESVTAFTSDGTINNPTEFESKPLIRIYGVGEVGIGAQTVTITAANEYTDLDCDIMEAYKGTQSCNANVEFSNNDYPVLSAGTNGITLGEGITRVEITPRWVSV